MLRTTAALVFVAGALSACRPSPRAEAPGTAAVVDDLDEIEAELSRNAQRLEGQGIRIAALDRAAAPQTAAPSDPAKDSGGDATTERPEPEPAPTPEPVSPTIDADADADEDDAPMAPPEPDREAEYASDETRAVRAPRRRSAKNRRAGKRDAATRCERICDLAEATCDLSDRICELADTHVDDVRYANACQRAELQCEAAAEACTGCAD